MIAPLRFDEVGALRAASSELHWNAIVRQIVRVRNGAMPSDWTARVENSGLRAMVSARWQNRRSE